MNPESLAFAEKHNRFVVLHHRFPECDGNGRTDHFDLMLELESTLATWAINSLPDPGETVPATRLADHRKLYLDYEGPISNDRGSVTQVMAGTYRIIRDSSSRLDVQLNSNHQCVQLRISLTAANATIQRVDSVTDRQ